MPDGAVLTAIRLDEPVDLWTSAGFAAPDDRIRLGGVTVSFDADAPTSLGFDRDVGGPFCGIETHVASPTSGPPTRHDNGVDGLDHVVVMSGDLDRTLSTLDPSHFVVRRMRETVVGGREVSQAFIVARTAVIEIVGPRTGPNPPERATLWGLAATATRLEDCVEYWDEACSEPRAAVQAGRRIVSVGPPAWISRYHLAVMSPRSTATPGP